MTRATPSSDLDFYRKLRRYDTSKAHTRHALVFARSWSDLALRSVAAYCAQIGIEIEMPPSIGLPALTAYLEHGPGFSTTTIARLVPADWPVEHLDLILPLASWLSEVFNPADPFASSFQVWCGDVGSKRIRLFGQQPKVTSPPPITFQEKLPLAEYLDDLDEVSAALIAHYDLHGLTMLAVSKRQLERMGVASIDCAMGFEWTGDISKLWKRSVPKTIEHDPPYDVVLLLDCSVHSRHPERTIKAVNRLDNSPSTRLVIIDHHTDTFHLAPQLIRDGLDLVFTDVTSCCLTDSWDDTSSRLMALGALGDKAPEIANATDASRLTGLNKVVDEYNRWMVHFSPTPKALKDKGLYPLAPLWDALSNGREPTIELSHEVLGEMPESEPNSSPEVRISGSILFVTEKPSSVGRTWYGMLELLMEANEVSYACALRILNETRGNILLLTRWKDIDMPPIKHFIPQEFLPRCLGHPGAVWVDLEKHDVIRFLGDVDHRVNAFHGTPGAFLSVETLLRSNILNPIPSVADDIEINNK